MTDAELPGQITAWLTKGRKRLNPVFSPALEARFEADTGPERARRFGVYCLVSMGLFLIWDPEMMLLHPETLMPRLYHLVFSFFMIGVSASLLRGHWTKFARESICVFISLIITFSLTLLYDGGVWTSTSLYTSAVFSGLVATTAFLTLRFPYALFTVICTIVMATLGYRYGPPAGAQELRDLVFSMVISGSWLLFACSRRERDERQAYLIGLQQDLAGRDLSRLNMELEDLSKRDPLTGLANRRAHDAWLREAWERSMVQGTPVGVIMVDVDRFKDYNDFYGHPAGDLCLAAVGRCLRDMLRGTTDFLARFGGEEFVVLLPGVPEAECADVAERLRAAVEALELPHLGVSSKAVVTISAGVASVVPQKMRRPEALLGAADEALYTAKRLGRNQVAIGQLARPEVEEEERLFLEMAAKKARVA